jgi:hypothetical protein
VVSDRLPTLGGSVASGAGAALFVGDASMDARLSSSLAAHGGIIGMVVAARFGPSVVGLVFLFFFFSSFFFSMSLRGRGREVRRKVNQELNLVQVVLMRHCTRPNLSCQGGQRPKAEVPRSRRPAPCCGGPPSLVAGWRARR